MGNFISSLSDFTVSIKTGEMRHGGTDNDVCLVLYDKEGQSSKTQRLDHFLYDDFETGNTDIFAIKNEDHLGHVKRIEIWREGTLDDDWYVETIVVQRKSQDDESIFPIHRWIPKNKKESLVIQEYDSTLPQDSEQHVQRKKELAMKQFHYELGRKENLHCPFVQIKNLPEDEQFHTNFHWDLERLKLKLGLSTKMKKLALGGEWKDLDDTLSIYWGGFDVPLGAKEWRTDKAFGRQQLCGVNPKTIRLCQEIPAKLAVSEENLKEVMEGMTVEAALGEKKLFIIDYEIMDNILEEDDTEHVMCAPIALFYLNQKQELLPVAIQLEQEPAEDNPVFYPTDPEYTWMMAKMWFNLADSAYHQGISHLGFTHLAMESICLATHRQLSRSHPVFRLLAPHFMHILAINTRGLARLLNPKGWVDETLGAGTNGMMEIIRRGFAMWRLDVQGTLPNNLKDRQVDDPKVLPNYPYRDDALPVFYAIQTYVRTIITARYTTVERLQNDHEIQNWAKELSAPYNEGGVNVKGIPGGGVFSNADDLIATLTSIIFTCSVEHAAVNFLQYDYFGFPPAYTYWLLGTERPKNKRALSEQDIVKALPSKDRTLQGMLCSKVLSSRGTRSLGDFEVQYSYDPYSIEALKRFKEELKEIEKETLARDAARDWSYQVLLPSVIPNSISI